MDAPVAVPIEIAAEPGSGNETPLRIEIPIVVPSTEQCPPHQPGEIVVCATDQEAYRLHDLPEAGQTQPPRAETEIAPGATAGVSAESARVGGWPSHRVMVTVTLKF